MLSASTAAENADSEKVSVQTVQRKIESPAFLLSNYHQIKISLHEKITLLLVWRQLKACKFYKPDFYEEIIIGPII